MRGSTQALFVGLKQVAVVAVFVVSMGQLTSSVAQVGTTKQQAPAATATIDPKVIATLRASCDTLSAAKTMTFTAVNTFERAAHNGQPLYNMVLDHVTMRRPDKLRVRKLGDGIPNEFYYDGETMAVYVPSTNVISIANVPPTIDEMLDSAWDVGAIYFPFANVLISRPCSVLDGKVKSAFYVGQSTVVGGITTDVVAVTGSEVQAELWVGVADHLPRMLRATYSNVPGHPQYQIDYSDWHLDARVEESEFDSGKAATAKRLPFESAAASPPPSGGPSPTAQGPARAAPEDQPLPPIGSDGTMQFRAQRASIIIGD
jgi:hypothetical protein